MNAKTMISRHSTRKMAKSNSREAPSSYSADTYSLCQGIVSELTDTFINDIIGRYEASLAARFESSFNDFFDMTNTTMLSFEALERIDFLAVPICRTAMSDSEPTISDADNYNRKVVDHRALNAPRSAIDLHGKSLVNIRSALSMSRLPRASVKKQPRVPQNCLQIDFNRVILKRAETVEAQLRNDKATSLAKAKAIKFMPKVI